MNSGAFQDCTGIKKIIFLGNPPTLYNDTLRGMTGLEDIYVAWEYGQESHEPWSAPANATIHYKSEGWMDELDTILGS